jgi:Holliday junction resolvasome RuvABC endonuclease subunit
MRVLGIDPATKCGWAVWDGATCIASGVWNLTPRAKEPRGVRWIKFRTALESVLLGYPPHAIGYEKVRRHAGTAAAHMYGAFEAMIEAAAHEHGLPLYPIEVSAAKKLATGKGNADKAAMVAAAEALIGRAVADDTEADAVWIGLCTLEQVEPSCESK